MLGWHLSLKCIKQKHMVQNRCMQEVIATVYRYKYTYLITNTTHLTLHCWNDRGGFLARACSVQLGPSLLWRAAVWPHRHRQ